MANMLYWLRDRRPKDNTPAPGIDRLADDLWKSYLERTGRAGFHNSNAPNII